MFPCDTSLLTSDILFSKLIIIKGEDNGSGNNSFSMSDMLNYTIKNSEVSVSQRQPWSSSTKYSTVLFPVFVFHISFSIFRKVKFVHFIVRVTFSRKRRGKHRMNLIISWENEQVLGNRVRLVSLVGHASIPSREDGPVTQFPTEYV